MGIPYELFLAIRYLRPKRTFVSIITLISVMGVTLGVAVLIIVISVMTGFDRDLRDKILGFNAHLRVLEAGQPMRDYEKVEARVRSNDQVRGVAPYVLGPVLAKTQPEIGSPRVHPAMLKGIDTTSEREVSNLHNKMAAGQLDLTGHGLVIGIDMANDLNLSLGDRITVLSFEDMDRMYRAQGGKDEVVVLPDEFEIRGIFNVGYYEFDSRYVVMSLESARDLYGLDDSIHGLMVMLKDPFQAESVRHDLDEAFGGRYPMSLWTEENSFILDALVVEKNVMFYLLFFIMIVAAFGIMNSLITFAVQKTPEIGMLKALGAKKQQIVSLFFFQSLLVGLLGSLLGLGLGMLALHYRNEFLALLSRRAGIDLFPAQVYGFGKLPALIVPSDIAWICGSALVICVLAAALPAWIAARLHPVEALRHE